jgi:flagellar basal-body rod protein FlgC
MNRPSLWLAALSFMFAACQGQEYVHGGERTKYYTMLEAQVKDTEFVKFLRDRGVKLERDENGLLRIYVHGTPETIPAVVKFLGHMKMQMELIVSNLANANTTRPAGMEPYRRKGLLIDKDGNASIIDDKTQPYKRYEPGHPHADKDGYVSFPNINIMQETLELFATSREYHLAEVLLERCLPGNYVPDYAIQMMRWQAEHFIEIEGNRVRFDLIEQKLDALKPAK